MIEDKYAKLISLRIQQMCHERGELSLYTLSKISGVSMSTIENIVQCNTKSPGIQTMHRLANGLNMTISEFLDCPAINDYEFNDDESGEYAGDDDPIIG